MRPRTTLLALGALALGAWVSPTLAPMLSHQAPLSPFALFGRDDMRAGRRFALYESAARKEQHRPYRCKRLWARALVCSVETIEIPGELTLVVDSTDHAILIGFAPSPKLRVGERDARALQDPQTSAAILAEMTAVMKTAWDSTGTSSVDTTLVGADAMRWVDRSGRWIARVWYERPKRTPRFPHDSALLAELPDGLVIADLPAMKALVSVRRAIDELQIPLGMLGELARPVTGDAQRAALPPDLLSPRDAIRRMEMDLRTLLVAQGVFHGNTSAYTRDFDVLKFLPSPGVQVRFVTATAHGWVATTTFVGLANRSCVVWEGAVGRRPRTLRGRSTERAAEIVCDKP